MISAALVGSWLLFVQVPGEILPRQYGPFTSESSCMEMGRELDEIMNFKLKDYWCYAN